MKPIDNLDRRGIVDGLEAGLRDFLIIVGFVLSVFAFMTVAASTGRELTMPVRLFLEIAPLIVVAYMTVRVISQVGSSE